MLRTPRREQDRGARCPCGGAGWLNSDTSDIPNHLFAGQFYRWTIQLELQDGFLFSIPYKKNWRFIGFELATCDRIEDPVEFDVIEQKYLFDDQKNMLN